MSLLLLELIALLTRPLGCSVQQSAPAVHIQTGNHRFVLTAGVFPHINQVKHTNKKDNTHHNGSASGTGRHAAQSDAQLR